MKTNLIADNKAQEAANLVIEMLKIELEIAFDSIFESKLSCWDKPSKELKSKFLARIGKSWLLETEEFINRKQGE